MFVLLQPVSVVFHRLVPTSQRFFVWVAAALLLLPLYLADETLIRRGSFWKGVAWGVASKVVSIVLLRWLPNPRRPLCASL